MDDLGREYHEEMAEFEAMEDQIRDMDYYKAETEAARNGQEAAMAFAEDKAKEAAVHKLTAEFYIGKSQDLETTVRNVILVSTGVWLVTFIVLVLVLTH